MLITIDHYAEIRFTPDGRKIATWMARNMNGLRFQQHESTSSRRLSIYEQDTGEYEGTVDKLPDLPVNAVITVTGRVDVYEFKTPHGDKVKVNVFYVQSWEYDGWEWKTRNRRLGMAGHAK